jgi:hypothetical protein
MGKANKNKNIIFCQHLYCFDHLLLGICSLFFQSFFFKLEKGNNLCDPFYFLRS